MPPKARLSRQTILEGAIILTEQEGIDALTAKSLAQQLHCSTQPIFWYYDSLDEVRQDVEQYAQNLVESYLKQTIEGEPPYKAVGINYIRFADEHKHLFRMLYMSDKSGQDILNTEQNLPFIAKALNSQYKADEHTSRRIVKEMWLFAHGIATMLATSTAQFTKQEVSQMLTDVFRGLLANNSCDNINTIPNKGGTQ